MRGVRWARTRQVEGTASTETRRDPWGVSVPHGVEFCRESKERQGWRGRQGLCVEGWGV